MNKEIANRLADLRKKNGLSQEDLAGKLGISRQAVSKWERGEASPDLDNLIILSKLYGVSIDSMINPDAKKDDAAKEGAPDGGGGAAENAEASKTAAPNAKEKVQGEALGSEKQDSQSYGEANPDRHGESVHIGVDGIRVTEKNGGQVNIDSHGFKHSGDGDYEREFSVGDRKQSQRARKFRMAAAITSGVSVFVALAVTLLVGFFFPVDNLGWRVGWLSVFLIPIALSVVRALRFRRFTAFDWPVLAVGAYLLLGLGWGLWHPYWVIFFSIPVFYIAFGPIDRAIHDNWNRAHGGININIFEKDNRHEGQDGEDDVIDDDAK